MPKAKFSISLDADLLARLIERGKHLGLNRSQMIERCCEEAMQATLPGRVDHDAEHLLLFRGHSDKVATALRALDFHQREAYENQEAISQPDWIELRVVLQDKGDKTYTDYQERPL